MPKVNDIMPNTPGKFISMKFSHASPLQDSGFPRDSQFDLFSGDLFDYSHMEKKDRWSISWSDLMMTMFIFFVMMYVYQAGNRDLKFGEGPGGQALSDSGSGLINDVDLMKNKSDIFTQTKKTLLSDEWVENEVSVDLVKDKAIRITLAGDFFFDVGRADLKTASRWRLHQVADILKKNSFVINVVGHTDSVPNHSAMFPTNWELSSARACVVARFLIENEGIPEERFFVSAHSWHQPVAPNNTAYNRSLNRRVELILMKEMPYTASAVPPSTTNQ